MTQYDAQTQSAPHDYPSSNAQPCPRKYATPQSLYFLQDTTRTTEGLQSYPRATLNFVVVKIMKIAKFP
jgi:hypothetical protein